MKTGRVVCLILFLGAVLFGGCQEGGGGNDSAVSLLLGLAGGINPGGGPVPGGTTPGSEDTVHWNKYFDGNAGNDAALSAACDTDGNLYVVGFGTNLISNMSSEDWWIKKFDANGNEDTIHWNKKIHGGGTSFPKDRAQAVAVDSDGSVYVAGYGSSLVGTNTQEDWWIKKFDSDGNEDTTNWNKKIGTSLSDRANAIALDGDGNVYVAGTADNFMVWIKKFDPDGNEDTAHWNKAISDFLVSSMAMDQDGNVVVAGCGPGAASYDWLIKKFSADGVEDTANWNKLVDTSIMDMSSYVAVDSSGNVFVAGSVYNLISAASGSESISDWLIKKYTSAGVEDTTNWNKGFDGVGNDDFPYSAAVDAKGNVFVVGA